MNYPDQLDIPPFNNVPHATVSVPGSKSMTNRALIMASYLATAESAALVRGALHSEDTEVMVDSLQKLGLDVRADWQAASPTVEIAYSGNNIFPARQADLYVANSGTSMRFLTALVSAGQGQFRLDGVPRMRERPIGDLLRALQQLGVDATSETANDCPPVRINARGLPGGTVKVKGDISSQFLSGLLLAGPLARTPLTVEVEGTLVSLPYVSMTVEMMRRQGIIIETRTGPVFVVHPIGERRPIVDVEPDASAASYFYAAAAITGGSIGVAGLNDDSLQGDVRFVDALERMGCQVVRSDQTITVTGGRLRGIDIDMNAISDTVMTLGAVACFAEGPTTIRNVAHIRHKETDRLTALATELRRVGAGVDVFEDGLTIRPASLNGAEIETYDDHRMAMSLALVGLKVPGIVIKNPGCVAKTYPRFFEDLDKLRG